MEGVTTLRQLRNAPSLKHVTAIARFRRPLQSAHHQAALQPGKASACSRASLPGPPAPSLLTRMSPGLLAHPLSLKKEDRRLEHCCAPQAALPAIEADTTQTPATTEPFGRHVLPILRAGLFYITTMIVITPLCVCMGLLLPFELLADKYRRKAEHTLNILWAKLSGWPFFRVEIEGKENLPSDDTAAMYVANHSSYLDIYSLFYLNRSFKFISKLSNFFIPLVGWCMFFTGHVPLVRNNRKSQIETLKTCRSLADKGCSLLFFPEGTRTPDGKMHKFKKGAFSVAAKQKIPVVPVTLVGTYDMLRKNHMYPGTIKIVVHPPIDGNTDAETMMTESYKRIASALPEASVPA